LFIEKDIASYFYQLLIGLENQLRHLECSYLFKDLIIKIIECRTSLGKDLIKTSQWFQRSKTIAVDFKIEDALDTSIEIVNNLEPTTDLVVTKTINYDNYFYGHLFSYFVDLFKILLSNIVDYSKLNNQNKAYANISIIQENNQLLCSISNTIYPGTNLAKLDSKIAVKCKEIDEFKNTINIRNEGNTGLIKATNILKNVFHNPNNRINISRDENKVYVEFNLYWSY